MSYDIVLLTDSRSEYSLMKRTLMELNKYVKLKIIATGMHLSKQYGYTVEEIENDGFDVEKIETLIDSDTPFAMLKTLGLELLNVTQVIKKLKPKLIFVEGDRGNALIGAMIGAYLNIPVIHHARGDLSGSIDNKVRYAISMFADYHLVGNIDNYNRLKSMGTSEEKIFIVGEPGIDDIYLKNYTLLGNIEQKFKIDLNKPSVLQEKYLVKNIGNPYGNGQSYIKITQIILDILEKVKNHDKDY